MKFTMLFLLVFISQSFGQNIRSSHFFFNPLSDVSENNFIEASVIANGYSNYNREYLGIIGNYNIANFTIGAELNFQDVLSSFNIEPVFIRLGGRYNFLIDGVKLSAGSMLDFAHPFSENGLSFVSAFSAARYSVNDKIELAASLRLKSYTTLENFDELLGFGGIISLFPKLNLLTEMNYSVQQDKIGYGGGIEYEITKMVDLRGGYFVNILSRANTIYVGLEFNQFNF